VGGCGDGGQPGGEICGDDGGEKEPEEKPGERGAGKGASAEREGGVRGDLAAEAEVEPGGEGEGDGDDPEGADEFDGDGDSERAGAVAGGCADDGAGVVDGEGGPEAELLLGEVEVVSECGEEEEGDGVEDEDRAEGDGHGFFAGIEDRAEGGDGAAAADGSSGADEGGRDALDAEEAAEEEAEGECKGDADGGVEESGASGGEDLGEVHGEAEEDDGGLEEEVGELMGFRGEGVESEECKDESEGESERWGYESAGGEDDADKKEVAGCG
jgi:hypothetical protein